MADSKPVSSQLFGRRKNSVASREDNKSLGSVTLTRIPRMEDRQRCVGEARLKAQYTSKPAPEGSYTINFGDVAQIQDAMDKHSDVAALLFMSLPKLGGIVESLQAAEAVSKASVSDDTVALQAELAEAKAKCEQKSAQIKSLKKAAQEAAAECAQKDKH